jgi:hypothetical protein
MSIGWRFIRRAALVRSDLGGRSADFINVLDGGTGDVVRKVQFSNRSHDSLFPLSGPLFTKAEDRGGKYLYLIDPQRCAVSRIGPYAEAGATNQRAIAIRWGITCREFDPLLLHLPAQ